MQMKKNLENLKANKVLVERDRKKLLELKPEIVIDCAKDYHGGVPHNIKIEGYNDYEIKNQKAIYINRLQKTNGLITEAEEFISSIDDAEMQNILAMIYIDGLTHWEIGKRLGYTKSAITKKVNRFWKCPRFHRNSVL